MAAKEFHRLGRNAVALFHDLIHDPDLVALWPLNEAAGTILDRCTRYRLTGTVAGNPVYGKAITPGFSGLDFDGTGDLISLGNVAALDFERTDAFSLFAVVVPEDLTQARTIIGKFDTAASRGWYWRLSADAAPLQHLVIANGGANLLLGVSTSAVAETVTSDIGVSYDGSITAGGVAFYNNGVDEANLGGAPSLSATSITTDVAQIGARDSTELWRGDLAFVAVFDAVKRPMDYKRWHYLAGT